MWAIKTIWTIFIWLFIIVIVFEVKDWKSRNKEK
jgi:hypothetical protein